EAGGEAQPLTTKAIANDSDNVAEKPTSDRPNAVFILFSSIDSLTRSTRLTLFPRGQKSYLEGRSPLAPSQVDRLIITKKPNNSANNYIEKKSLFRNGGSGGMLG
ncbi:MAG TPA: hypothetical protein VJM51_07950, partial [Dehalococcoidia bacterium]|nr:hypothetical protein [Dehalococcoidia bacterium]